MGVLPGGFLKVEPPVRLLKGVERVSGPVTVVHYRTRMTRIFFLGLLKRQGVGSPL
jgi:hypothetical protein